MRIRHLARLSNRGWMLYLTVYLVGLVPFVLMPIGPVGFVYFQILAWSGVIMLVAGVLRGRPLHPGPLWLLVAAQSLTATGVFVLAMVPVQSVPGHSDAFFLLGSLAQIAGMVWLVRRRVPARNRESLLDAAIISSGFALLACVFLIKPAMTAAGSLPGAIVGATYPVVDLFVLTLLVSLLLGGGLHNTAMRLIAIGQLIYLIADSALGFLPPEQLGNPLVFSTVIAGELLVYGMFGAAALHPGFRALTVAPTDTRPGTPWLRTPLLWLAVTAGPALLVFEAWQYHMRVPDAVVIASGCIVIFSLVVARLQALVSRVNLQSVVLAEQAEHLKVLATRDGLTGLINRHTWDSVLPDELERARRYGLTVTVAVIDIDHFKRYNDRLGHQAGDRLLKSAAAAWAAELRKVDVLARYGGEEFIALLPECDATAATEVVQRLRAVTPDGQTFSAGIATWNREESDDVLFSRADAALYEAKNAGRDRTTVAAADRWPPTASVGGPGRNAVTQVP
jgi:diguanylate cyclase (GGDEF)-like protein